MSTDTQSASELQQRYDALLQRLAEAEEALAVIRSGEVDGLIVEDAQGAQQVYLLRDADRTYRTFVEQMHQGAAIVTPDGMVSYCNRRLGEILRARPENIRGASIGDFFVPSDGEKLGRALAEPECSFRGELKLARANAGTPVHLAATPLAIEDFAAIGLIVTDLADERRAAMIESALDAIIRHDLGGVITDWNPAAERTYGYTFQEAVGKHIRLIIPEERQGEDEGLIAQVRLGRQIHGYETVRLAKDGRQVHVALTLSTLDGPNGKAVAIASIERDITLRRRAEEALRQSEEQARRQRDEIEAIYNSARIGLCVFDTEIRFLRVNERFAEMNGRPVSEHLGRPLRELMPALADQGEAIAKRVFESGEPVLDVELRGTTAAEPQVERIWIEQWLPLKNAAGRIVSINVVAEEITAQKRLEQDLRELNETLERRVAERSAMAEERARHLQRLASELADAEHRERRQLARILHDGLQQLLVAARLRLSAAAGDPKGRSQTLKQIDELLVECLRDSRTLTMELSPPILTHGTLAEVFEWLAEWFGEKYSLAISVDAEASLPPVPEHLRVFLYQAARELLFNVVKHSDVPEAAISLGFADGWLAVEVADRGGAFDAEAVQRALVSPKGFGLFSIRERLAALEGRLEIEGGPQGGGCFRLIVPVEVEVATQRPNATPDSLLPAVRSAKKHPSRAAGQRIRLLLVDDHQVVRDGLAGLLNHEQGFEIVGEAGDGEEAVRQVDLLRPDVVIMDVAMPRLDGIEATRRIKRRHADVQVIGLSFHSEESIRRELLEAGAADYCCKDSPGNELLDTIRRVGLRK